MKKIIFTLIFILTSLLVVEMMAQDEQSGKKIGFSVGGELVSSYVWRGAFIAGTSIQPAMGMEIDGFSLSAWGSVDVYGGGYKEVDFTASYSIAGIHLALTDYWWAGEGTYKYFMYDNHETTHHFEGTIGYTLPVEKFPLIISWNTIFAGEDAVTVKGDRAYSTYIEAAYPFTVKNVHLDLQVAMTPWKGIYASELSVVSIGLKATKEVKVTERFSFPVFGHIITNPRSEDIFFVFGLGF